MKLSGANGSARRLLSHPEAGLVLVILLMFGGTAFFSRTVPERVKDAASGKFFTVQRNVFLKPQNLQLIGREASYFAIMAVGATLVLVCGGVDLSIGSIFCLSAVVAACLMSATTYTGQTPAFPEQEAQWIAADKLPSAAVRITLGAVASC